MALLLAVLRSEKIASEAAPMERGPRPLPLYRQPDQATPVLNLPTLFDFSDRRRDLPDRRSWPRRFDIPQGRTTRAA